MMAAQAMFYKHLSVHFLFFPLNSTKFIKKIKKNLGKIRRKYRKLDKVLEEGSIVYYRQYQTTYYVHQRQYYWTLLEKESITYYELLKKRSITYYRQPTNCVHCRQTVGRREYSIYYPLCIYNTTDYYANCQRKGVYVGTQTEMSQNYSQSKLTRRAQQSSCYESPKQEKVFYVFEHLIQNLKAYNGIKI